MYGLMKSFLSFYIDMLYSWKTEHVSSSPLYNDSKLNIHVGYITFVQTNVDHIYSGNIYLFIGGDISRPLNRVPS